MIASCAIDISNCSNPPYLPNTIASCGIFNSLRKLLLLSDKQIICGITGILVLYFSFKKLLIDK